MVRLAMQAHVAEATTEVYKPSASIGLESIAFRSDTGQPRVYVSSSAVKTPLSCEGEPGAAKHGTVETQWKRPRFPGETRSSWKSPPETVGKRSRAHFRTVGRTGAEAPSS